MTDFLLNFLSSTWSVVVAASEWLIYGILIASFLKLFLSAEKIAKHLKEPNLKSVLKASAFGVPLPLCSCSVIPVALMLRKSGASKGAVGSFLVSTPEIGVDSFFLSYGLLGPLISILRVAAAFFSALFVGLFINLSEKFSSLELKENIFVDKEEQHKSCCSKDKPIVNKTFKGNFKSVLKFGFIDLIDDMSVSLLIGFVCSGLVAVLVPADYSFSENLSLLEQMLIMILISVPLYVCASSSTPIGAMLLYKGMSPGAVLIFLLAGPATNMATIFVVRNQLGKNAFYIYVAVISVISFLFGVLANALVSTTDYQEQIANMHHHQESYFFGILLLALLGFSYFKKIKKFLSSKQKKAACCH
ncbi:MAG: SO_0444 family Cu/Zn efflux transporter [Proteobacteria bacterium]|nr:SO_0444 family Cu/Zn efflux transporter [Pseudomonadota bacterium]